MNTLLSIIIGIIVFEFILDEVLSYLNLKNLNTKKI
jgi:hypothetical protein